jgi:hypothetical protein
MAEWMLGLGKTGQLMTSNLEQGDKVKWARRSSSEQIEES